MADESLRFDRRTKSALYARAGIPSSMKPASRSRPSLSNSSCAAFTMAMVKGWSITPMALARKTFVARKCS